MSDLLARARLWMDEDPDPVTRAELAELISAGKTAELADRFAGPLDFGTAGLRGALGAGPNRMNRVVVIRAAAGLAAHLQARGATGPVVIGYDARRNSDVFARDTADVLSGTGIGALVLPGPVPTPVLAYAIRHLGAAAGVMVTASHNPRDDNGYKVYLGDGSQIVAPADAEIAARIAAVGPLNQVPRSGDWQTLDDSVRQKYVADTVALVDSGPRELKVAYTPLHGVGLDTFVQVFARAGFQAPIVVPEQAAPDGAFPTVEFPNPEEPGAMDLLMSLAVSTGADIALANDPDADRCAVAVPTASGWRMLTGDEVGALLAYALLPTRPGTYATSIVSSSLLSTMAARAGRAYAETLTGFKWIGRIPGLAFGYEEALGYCVDPDHVKDKDGISAALVIADLAARLKAEARTVPDALNEIARDHGLHATAQISIRVGDISEISAAMARLRASPPASLDGWTIERIDDLAAGVDGLPPTDGLRYHLGDGARVIVRPSGTEPKLKCYLEVVVPVTAGVEAARTEGDAGLRRLRSGITHVLGLGPDQ
jgi:phosphomannomutase